ncbi:MAG TPA: hypothetical protein VGM88_20980 [Kofleriaceae bacterium]
MAHPKPAIEESPISEAKLRPMIEEGTRIVREELAKLRAEGKIDEHGNILVPWPDDMRPDSETDL